MSWLPPYEPDEAEVGVEGVTAYWDEVNRQIDELIWRQHGDVPDEEPYADDEGDGTDE